MSFSKKIEAYMSVFEAVGEPNPQDATTPAPNEDPAVNPQIKTPPQALPPEGYVDLVRLLAKALIMNIPSGSIDTLFTTTITRENVENIREGLQEAISQNLNYEDNPERLDNPHFKQFVDTINEDNFMAKYKQILSAMKRYSNDVKS